MMGRRRKGMGGHQSAKAVSHTWLTPRHILDALGPFDLDPCAAPEPRPWPTAATHYTLPDQDGLTSEWFGRCWVNPPYGPHTGVWLDRLARHGTGTALVFARTEAAFFFDAVWERADALLFLRGRLHFHLPDGTRAQDNGGAPSVLIAYGHHDAERLLDSGLDGAVVGLRRPVMIHLACRLDGAEEGSAETWREIVAQVVGDMGGRASLSDMYERLEGHPRIAANANWKAKIRQTVARSGMRRVAAGTYETMAKAA